MKITILGAGKLGTNIANTFLASGNEITIVDKNADVVQRISQRMDLRAITANAKNIETLKNIDIENSDALIACTDDDDKNMVLCSLAKELGAKKCVARVTSPEYVSELPTLKKAMGIDLIVNPDLVCANEIFRILTANTLNAKIEAVNGLATMEFCVDDTPFLVNQTLISASQYLDGILISAILRSGKLIIPNGSSEIKAHDRLYAVGERVNIKKFNKKLRSKRRGQDVNRVMIAGGGRTGMFLAKDLADDGADVRIIENDPNRARYLAEKLPKVYVTHGDATDVDLLLEEDLRSMDALVACTGIDEANIMLTITAKQHGIKNSIAKMSRNLHNIAGDITTINSVELCTAGVLRYLNQDNHILFSKIIQGQAELSEIKITSSMPIAGKSLMEIKPNSGILIAMIRRDGVSIIPNGRTVIEVGDEVMFLTLISQLPELEKLLKSNIIGEF